MPSIHKPVAAICLAVASAFVQAQEASYTFNIPPQPLSSALSALSNQTGLQFFYAEKTVSTVKSNGVQGKMSVREAVANALNGTGLTYEFTAEKTIAIKRGAIVQKQLPEISVIATRTATPVQSTPASISVAGQNRFEEVQSQTILPVVKSMPNVEMGGGPRVEGLIPTIRGSFGAGVTLLMDGARQNDLQQPGMKSPLFVDPYFIKEMEVLRGASSSLYGTGGNGGVMSVSSLSARDLLDSGQNLGGGVKAGWSSADNSMHNNARIYGGNDVVDALIAAGDHQWHAIRLPGGDKIDPNEGKSQTGLIKLGVNPSLDSRVELSHQTYRSDQLIINNPQASRYSKLSDPASIRSSIPYIQPNHVEQSNTVIKATSGDVEAVDKPYIVATAYQSYLQTIIYPYATNTAYNNTAATATNYGYTRTQTDGATLQATKVFGHHRISVGGDLYADSLKSRSGTTVNVVNPAGGRTGKGMFIQDEISLGNGWKLLPTVRYDEYEASAQGSTLADNKAKRVSPKLTVSWENERGLLVYGSYGEGFRAPAVNELYQTLLTPGYPSFALSNFKANPDLNPEIDRTVELGAKSKQNNVLNEGDTLKLRTAIFNSQVQDMIYNTNIGAMDPGYASTCSSTGTKCIWQYQNVPSARRYGGEAEASYTYGPWQYNLAYGVVRVANTGTGDNLFSPPDKLNFLVRRQLPQQGLSVLWNSTFVARQDYDTTVLRQRPGYAVHDLYVSWMPATSKIRVDAGIANLFNREYYVYQSANAYAYTSQPARTFMLSVGADF